MKKNGVIAFCGSKGAGKNTSADIFKEITGLPTEELALAGHLKEVCAPIFGVECEKFIKPELKEVELDEYIVLNTNTVQNLLEAFHVKDYNFDKNVRPHLGKVLRTPRALLQYIGTEVLHPIDPLIHAKITMRKKDPNKLTILTDLRFVNEFNYFHRRDDFMPVYVKNSRAEIAASVDPHPSEQEMHRFKNHCYLIYNEGALDELRQNLRRMIDEVGLT